MNVSWMIGVRMLTSRQKSHISFITFMAVTGVTIGVSALLIITAISTGFLEAFKEKVLGVNAHVIVLKVGETFHEYRDVTKISKREEGVVEAAPFIITEMMLAKGKSISGILIKGIEPKASRDILDLPSHIVDGELSSLDYVAPQPAPKDEGEDIDIDAILDDESESETARDPGEEEHEKKDDDTGEKLPGMIIGKTLSENLHLGIGDKVRVISPLTGLDTSFVDNKFDTSVSANFEVTGIFYSGFDEYDSRLVYVNLLQAQ